MTVVTVVRNAVSAIEPTLTSIFLQDYPAVECIVIDGLSTDGTLGVIAKHRDRIAAFRSESDSGIYDAMNKGAALATGEWIIFMNAGDAFCGSDALTRLKPQLQSDADVICGATEQVLVDAIETRRVRVAPGNPDDVWRHMPACHQATLVRRDLQQRYGFDTSFHWCADHDLLARMYRDGRKFVCVDEAVCVFDCAGGKARDPMLYIRERWRLSRRVAGLPRRIAQYGAEWLHCKVWGGVVSVIRPLLSPRTLRSLRRIRGTAGTHA